MKVKINIKVVYYTKSKKKKKKKILFQAKEKQVQKLRNGNKLEYSRRKVQSMYP